MIMVYRPNGTDNSRYRRLYEFIIKNEPGAQVVAFPS